MSAVPPTPMPSMPGGHQPAPISGTVSSTQSTIESDGFSIANVALFSEPPPFAATVTSTLSPGNELDVHDGRRVVAGVLSRKQRIRDDRGPQSVVGCQVAAAHAFIHHLLEAARRVPAHAEARLHEHVDDASVLADRPPAFRAHARIGQDLRDRVLRRGRLLALVGAREVRDVVGGVVVGDELQGVRDALHEVRFTDQRRNAVPLVRNV